jgi:hypothetical protein
MRLSVKVLGGVECCVDAQEDYTVEQLKADIEAKLKLGRTEQKLLYKGKTLHDGTSLSAYQLTDGSKLSLILKREAATPSPGSAPATRQNCGKDKEEVITGTLEEELFNSLRKHFKNDVDTKTVVHEILKIYEKRIASLSLDDIERISKNYQVTKDLIF